MTKNPRKALNIWLLNISEQLALDGNAPRMRTGMLGEALTKRGHNVAWWRSTFDHQKKTFLFDSDVELATNTGVKLIGLKGTGYKKNISLRRFIDHRIIARKFRQRARRSPRPDVIVCSIPAYDIAYEAVQYAKENKIPVLVDIRDPWPDILVSRMPKPAVPLARFLLSRDFGMARTAMREADGLLAVSGSLLDWGLGYAKRPARPNDQVFYIGYQRPSEPVERPPTPRMEALVKKLAGKFLVTYVGTFGAVNNPRALVNAAHYFTERDILFVAGGSGVLFDQIRSEADGLQNIVFPGWLNALEISWLFQQSHVGVCPFWPEVPSVPNKVFSYLSEGLPLISSCSGDLKAIIEKENIGLHFELGDTKGLVAAIRKLHGDASLRRKMADNARRLFDGSFDAARIYTNYAAHVERMAGISQ